MVNTCENSVRSINPNKSKKSKKSKKDSEMSKSQISCWPAIMRGILCAIVLFILIMVIIFLVNPDLATRMGKVGVSLFALFFLAFLGVISISFLIYNIKQIRKELRW